MDFEQKYCFHCCLEKNQPQGCSCNPQDPATTAENHPSFLQQKTILDGRYIVGRVLGHGGFGVTYLGIEANLGFRVAIKEFMPKELASRGTNAKTVMPFTMRDEQIFQNEIDKFIEEGKSLGKFNHPNIVEVLSFFRENGTAYLVMRYLDGLTLEEFRSQAGGQIDQETALSWTDKVLDALEEIHRKGMIHRDIKPPNIYLTTQGQIKLLDFGAARAVSGDQSPMTQMWTPGYAPPEQCIKDGNMGAWTDTYAMGATLYALLTGQTPTHSSYRTGSEQNLLSPKQILGEKIEQHVSDAILKALELDIQNRFQTVSEFRLALQDQAYAQSSPPPSFTAAPSSSPEQHSIHPNSQSFDDSTEALHYEPASPKSKNKWVLPLVFMLIVIVGFGIFMQQKPKKTPELQVTIQPVRAKHSVRQVEPARPNSELRLPELREYKQLALARTYATQEKYLAASSIYQSLRQATPLPMPEWKLLAYQALMLAKAKEIGQASQKLQQAEEKRELWKKSFKSRGGYYRTRYIREETHHLFGKVYWALVQASSNSKQKLTFLGKIWSYWYISPHSKKAESLWWRGIRRGSFGGGLSDYELYLAAKKYNISHYGQPRKSKILLKHLMQNGTPGWKRKSMLYVFSILFKAERWGELKRMVTFYIQKYPYNCRSRRCRRKYRSLKKGQMIAQRYLSIATYFLHGETEFEEQLSSLSKRNKTSVKYKIAGLLEKQGKLAQASLMYSWIQKNNTKYLPNSIAWYMGVLYYAQKKYSKAYQQWDQARISLDPKKRSYITFGFWTAKALEQNGQASKAKQLYSEICRSRPLDYFGQQSCQKITRTFQYEEPSSPYGDWFPSNEDKARIKALKKRSDKKGLLLEMTRQMHRSFPPPNGLVDRLAEEYFSQKNYATAFALLKAYRLKDLQQGTVSKKIYRIAFPKPSSIWRPVQRLAKRYNIDPYLVLSMIRFESDFDPNYVQGFHTGILGLHPNWSSRTPISIGSNLKIGLRRYQKLLRKMNNKQKLAVASFRGFEGKIKATVKMHPNLPTDILMELSHLAAPNAYARSQSSGVLWYYSMYRWIYK